ncbi:Type 1 glutamine amidotransferase-like domain-containing protein [Cytobacillus oceanisediminis]|uniref:Type 1 glutamine amidotransferase-like domain-containing protein n=1 Tax=Cytobacillus oceanisediminis TaxID=665099 RepID=UPI00203F3B2A|nr:Type 1 glutamine amidotransferase-like domain-containing protein [Cytobacillus oceanisediminis]MCM3392844.1 Type 1 glutamine amidotransferase-like domain-containing protein [Cytobacillus oceanisediminis]
MKQIIALGGGGFSMEPDNPLLDAHILKQSGKPVPSICFVPTASGDSDQYTNRFYHFFEKMPCQPSHLSLFKPPARDIEGFIMEKDIIYVGGGCTKNLVALWKEWGLDALLKKAWNQGIILAGISAGSLCWFEEGVTDSFGDEKLDPLKCLGFLKGSNCPHYDGELNRRPSYHRLMSENKIKAGIAADDGAAIHYIDQDILRIVSSRPDARAYRVYFDGEVKEEVLEAEFLG